MPSLTEDWGSTLGTVGRYGWTKGTSSWFSLGALRLVAHSDWLSESASTNLDVAYNELRTPMTQTTVLNSQRHYWDGTNTAIFTRLCTKGTESWWGCASGDYAANAVALQIFRGADNSTASLTLLAKAVIGTGTVVSGGTLRTSYDSGTWIITMNGASNGGSAFVGTLRYAATGWVPGSLYPALAIQNLFGSTRIHSSYWNVAAPTSYGLTFTWGTDNKYADYWHPTYAQMPSSMTFLGQPSLITRSRALYGSLNAVGYGFKCRCDLYWTNASDATLALIGSMAAASSVNIECAWGTFLAKYIPESWTYSRYLDDVNTTSISFIEAVGVVE